MANTIIGTPFLDILLCAYPAYCSAGALRSHNKEKIIQFMTYWMLFAVFSTVESHLLSILKFVPIYFVCRRLICIWCVLPIQKNGGTVIYRNLIKRFFNEVNQDAQEVSHRSLERVIRTAEDLRHKATSHLTWDAADESSESTRNERLLVSGLEQLRGKTAAYRNKVMNQMLKSLRIANVSTESEPRNALTGMSALDEEDDDASESPPPPRLASALTRGLSAQSGPYPSSAIWRATSARAIAQSLSHLPPQAPFTDLYPSDEETENEDLSWT